MFKNTDSLGLDRLRRVAKINRLTIDEQSLSPEKETEILQAGLNGLVYSSAETWMLPLWARLQKQKGSLDSKGVSNDQFRNWTLIGSPGGNRFASTDESGLVNVIPTCGSLDFWPQDDEGIIFPTLSDRDGPRLSLVSPEDQLFEWKVIRGPIEFSRHIYHVDESGAEAIYNEILVKNHSLDEASFVFYAVVRPMSVRGVEPIEILEFDKTGRRLYANDTLAFSVDKAPDSVVMSTADNPNLIETVMTQTDRDDKEFSATRGLATAVLRFNMKLAPAASKRFFFMSPLEMTTKSDEVTAFPTKTSARDSNVGRWFDFVDSTASFAFPDRNLNPIVAQAKATIAMKTKSAFLGEPPDAYNWREKARVLLALSRIGAKTLSKEISLAVAKPTYIPEGANPSVLGPYLWGILQYYAHTRDLGFLRSINPFINDVTERLTTAIEEQIAVPEPPPSEPHTELPEPIDDENLMGVDEIIEATRDVLGEPPATESEVPTVQAPWTLSDLVSAVWTRAALLSVSAVFDALGEESRYKSLIEVIARYEVLVSKNAIRLADDSDAFASLEDKMEALNLLDAFTLLDWQSAPSNLVDTTIASINDALSRLLVKMPDETERISSHVGLRLAHFHVLRRNEYEASRLLERAKEFFSEFYTIPEFVNPRSGGGSSGDGCSLMAAVDLLIFIREMVLFEFGEDLVVLPSISDEWYTSSTPLTVKALPTINGDVDIEVGVSANQHQIEVRMKDLPRELIIHVPSHFALPMVKAFGGGIVDRVKDSESPYIRIMPLSNTVVATFHR